MSALTIRLLAMLLMLIDHIGALFSLPEVLSILFRTAGRISFPLFAFLIANGFRHTKRRGRYLLRLLAFALISEVFFDYAFYRLLWAPDKQNVFFTLTLGLLGLWIFDICQRRTALWRILGGLSIAALVALADLLHTDYGAFGVALILFLWLFRESKPLQIAVIGIFSLRRAAAHFYQLLKTAAPLTPPDRWAFISLGALLASLPILFYNGKRGWTPKSRTAALMIQYTCYLFYPLHLLVLTILKAL